MTELDRATRIYVYYSTPKSNYLQLTHLNTVNVVTFKELNNKLKSVNWNLWKQMKD